MQTGNHGAGESVSSIPGLSYGASNQGPAGRPIPTGPRAAMNQPPPRPKPKPQPAKAVDPSAMEVLGLAPPSRPPPPSSFNPAQHIAPQQQAHRPPPQQPGGPSRGQPAGVSTNFLMTANRVVADDTNSRDTTPGWTRKEERRTRAAQTRFSREGLIGRLNGRLVRGAHVSSSPALLILNLCGFLQKKIAHGWTRRPDPR